MKVIFLDFDGPLIPMMCHYPEQRALDEKAWPACVAELNRITESTGAKIVVSSTWRRGGYEYVRDLLRKWGVRGEVIGITPILDSRSGLVYVAQQRGSEIGEWLLAHPEVTEFVILDDDDDMGTHINSLILTPFETGITREHAEKAIEMLA